MANSPTFYRDAAAVAARSPESVDGAVDWNGGMNLAGSCAEGVGIATDVPNLTGDPASWTLLDQDGAARTPQVSQHIGGTGLGGTYPSSGGVEGKGTTPIDVGTPSATGDGTATIDGDATLATLAAGWTAV